MRRLVAEQLGVEEEQLVADTSLADELAADSLDLAALLLACETGLGIDLPDALFERVRTFGDLVTAIAERMPHPAHVSTCEDAELRLTARLVSPAGVTMLAQGLVLTPYTAGEIDAEASRSTPGTWLELTLPASATDATLHAVRVRFAALVRRGIAIDVRREPLDARPAVPPYAAQRGRPGSAGVSAFVPEFRRVQTFRLSVRNTYGSCPLRSYCTEARSTLQPADVAATPDPQITRPAGMVAWFLPSTRAVDSISRETAMNLFVWIPAMFALGLVTMGLCLAFVDACERI